MQIRKWIERLSEERAWRWGMWMGVILAVPSLLGGFFLDDYVSLLTLQEKVHMATPHELFQFAPGDPVKIREYMNVGPFPWFVLPELKISFMRPFTSLLMRLDFILFGEHAWAYHLVCVISYALYLYAARGLYRLVIPGALGAFTFVLFAVNLGHATAVIWWSNWNAMVSATPAIFGLLAHVYWRERGWKPGLPLSLAGYTLGLAGGETALGIFAYLFAYEMIAGSGKLKLRIGALIPAGIVGILYVVLYKSLDYGVHGSGLYLDPTHDTLEYLLSLPSHLILLIGAQFFLLPSEAAIIIRPLYWPLAFIGVIGLVLLWKLLRPAWNNLEAEQKRHMLWLGVGALISSLPVLATFPSIRLLTLPSLGAVPFLALLLRHLYLVGLEERPRWQRYVGVYLMLTHFLVGPLAWAIAPLGFRGVDVFLAHIYDTAEIDHANVENTHFVVLHAQDPLVGFYTIVRSQLEHPPPKSWWCLSLAPHAHEFTRTGERSFELKVVDGEMLTTNYEGLIRGDRFPMHIGEVVDLSGMRVKVLEMGSVGPTKIGVELDHPLEDERYTFLSWRERGLRKVPLPEIGGTVMLEKQPMI